MVLLAEPRLSVPSALLVAATSYGIYRTIRQRKGWQVLPFLLVVMLFLLGFLGLAISLWPNIVPPSISFREAAAPRSSQIFLLVGMLILLPVLIGYVAYTCWVFRGASARGVGTTDTDAHPARARQSWRWSR